MSCKIKCPHCQEEIEIAQPSAEDIKLQIIHTLYGGMSVPELEKWLQDNLLFRKK